MAPRLALASALTAALILTCSCSPLSSLLPQATAVPPTLEPTRPPPAAPSPTHTPLPPTATATPEPSPTSPPAALERSFVSVQMFSFSTGWAVAGLEGEVQRILRTADGGSTWTDVTPPEALRPTDPLLALAMGHFVDAGTAWVTYYDRYHLPEEVPFWRTRDGGLTWESTAPAMLGVRGDSYNPSLWFADARSGWFMALAYTAGAGGHADTQLFRTIDRGASWEGQFLSGCGHYEMSFSDADNGWITEMCLGPYMDPVPPTFRLIANGGDSFQHLSLPIPAEASQSDPPREHCITRSPWLFSGQSGVVIVSCEDLMGDLPPQQYLFPTSNGWLGDIVWYPYPGGTLQMVSEEVGWALGRAIYRTRDGGRSWGQVSTVEWDGQFSFIDGQEGWAVAQQGDLGILLHTADGSWTWQEVDPHVLP